LNAPRNRSLDVDYLESTFARFEAADDVFISDFTVEGVYVAQTTWQESATPTISDDVQSFLTNRSATLVFTNASHTEAVLPEGPYILQGKEPPELHQVWRMYPDEASAFVVGLLPADEEVEYK
jgi:hypothetical protein